GRGARASRSDHHLGVCTGLVTTGVVGRFEGGRGGVGAMVGRGGVEDKAWLRRRAGGALVAPGCPISGYDEGTTTGRATLVPGVLRRRLPAGLRPGAARRAH